MDYVKFEQVFRDSFIQLVIFFYSINCVFSDVYVGYYF